MATTTPVPQTAHRGSPTSVRFLDTAAHGSAPVAAKVLTSRRSTVARTTRADGSSTIIKIPHPDDEQAFISHYERVREAFPHPAPVWLPRPEVLRGSAIIDGATRSAVALPHFDGLDLRSWLDLHSVETDRVRAVAIAVAVVLAQLEAWGAEHGDLAAGNILVTPQDEVRLVDLDTIRLPSMAQDRPLDDSHTGDRLAGWLLTLGLLTVHVFPATWNLRSEDALLLGSADVLDLPQSARFARLTQLPHPIAQEWGNLEAYRHLPDELVTPVADESSRLFALCDSREDTPEPEPTSFQASPLQARVIMAAGSLAGLLLLALSAGLALVALSATAVAVVRLARLQEESHAKQAQRERLHTVQGERPTVLQQVGLAQSHASAVSDELAALDRAQQEAELRTRHEQAQASAQEQRGIEQELSTVRRQKTTAITGISTAERDLALQVKRVHVETRLRATSIPPLPGIGHGLLSSLRAHGFTTADHVRDVRTVDTTSGRRVAVLDPRGQWSLISGLGPTKGSTLLAWRRQVLREAERSVPAPTAAQRRAVLGHYEETLKGLEPREKLLQAQLTAMSAAGDRRLRASLARLRKQHARERGLVEHRASEADRSLRRIQAELELLDQRISAEERRLSSYRGITLAAYLAYCFS